MSGEASFYPTQRDWVAANQLWYRKARSRRVLRWVGAACLGLALLMFVLDRAAFRQAVGTAISDAAPLLMFGSVVIGLPALNNALIPRQVRRQFTQRSVMAAETRFAWNDEGLIGASRAGTTVQPWRELHRQLRDDQSFVFLLTDRMLLLVPRRALTADQADDLAATADRCGPTLG